MSLKTDQIKNELIRYLSVNPTLFSGMVLSSEVYINRFVRTIGSGIDEPCSSDF